MKYIENTACTSRLRCTTCVKSLMYREVMKSVFEWDGICPLGLTEKNLAKKMPSLLEQAKNATKAVGRAVKAKAKGEQVLVTDRVKANRQKICNGCEFYDSHSRRCSKCGCKTAYKLKMATEECPTGKWKKSRISKKAK